MKISELRKLLQLLEAQGHSDEFIDAQHDQLFLLPPGTIDEESEEGVQLSEEFNVCFSDDEGIFIFC